MSQPTRVRATVLVTFVVLAVLVTLLIVRPTKTAAASHTTATTIACSGPQLTTDYQIDQCLAAAMRVRTAQMNSSVRKESAYFHYATKAQDWRVAQRIQSTFMSYVRQECLAQANPYQSGTIVPIIFGECELGLFIQRLNNVHQSIASFKKGGEAQNAS